MEQRQSQDLLNGTTSRVLTWGFRFSAGLMVIGLILMGVQGEGLHTSLEGFASLADEIMHGRGAGIVGLAILVIIATPIASTLSILLSFVRLGDTRYAKITAAVVVILIISAAISVL